MKLELMKGDSVEVSDHTPMYNPQGLPLIFNIKLPRIMAATQAIIVTGVLFWSKGAAVATDVALTVVDEV